MEQARNRVKASIRVLKEEIQLEATERNSYTADDVKAFEEAILSPLILSAIRTYPKDLASQFFCTEQSDIIRFRSAIRNELNRLQANITSDIARHSSGRISLNEYNRDLQPTRMNQIELAAVSIASTAIDCAKRSIIEGDAVLNEIFLTVLRPGSDVSLCEWVSEEAIHSMHVFMVGSFEEVGVSISFEAEKTVAEISSCIEQYHPELSDVVQRGDHSLRTLFELAIEPICRIVFISEAENFDKKNE